MTHDHCIVCGTPLKNPAQVLPDSSGDVKESFDCPRCGKFAMSGWVVEAGLPDLNLTKDDVRIAILSHYIRKMQTGKRAPYIDQDLLSKLVEKTLPSLQEQINNCILWFGESSDPGKALDIIPVIIQSIIGSKTIAGCILVLRYLHDQGFLDGMFHEPAPESLIANLSLSMKGWNYYAQIKRGAVNSTKVFMAMKYGDKVLDEIVNRYFKPAVAATGFELVRLDDDPKAGLIDDRLRVEIRTSRFLISDLTHENAGAYWEAGFAEGLGKPVIYTCEKSEFDAHKTHFDTNHHLTVVWEKDNPEAVVERLKATIRATMLGDAKLTDD